MSNQLQIILEQWNGSYKEKSLHLQNSQELLEVIRSMEGKHSIMLTLENQGLEHKLIISASGNIFTVTFIANGNEFYDLINDPLAAGIVMLVIGGQEAQYPNKYLVNIEKTFTPALEFFNTGFILINDLYWDKTGNNDAWQQEGLVKG